MIKGEEDLEKEPNSERLEMKCRRQMPWWQNGKGKGRYNAEFFGRTGICDMQRSILYSVGHIMAQVESQ